MNPRGHRGFAAALMLLVLVLSAMALLPARAQAPSNQITGLVSQCGSSTTFIAGAQVTLTDANGILPSQTVATAGDGTFAFTPPPSNYTLSVTKTGYYANSTGPLRFDGSITVNQNICLTVQPAATLTITFSVVSPGPGPAISGAAISLYNTTRLPSQWSSLVYTNTTNATGKAIAKLWAGKFDVRVTASGFAPFVQTMAITASGTITIQMSVQSTVVGHARNTAGQFVSAGLVGWLYNLGVPAYNGTKVIKAVVNGSLFTFNAPAGSYRMIVDADGYKAFELPLSLPAGAGVHDANLTASPQELFQTTVLFGATDWNNITVYHNLTLNADSALPGLNPAGLRDLRLQISDTLGNSFGSVGANEMANFTAWLHRNGPAYVTTDTFLLVNGKAYNSSVIRYTVSVSGTLLTPGARVWINTSTTYQVKSKAWISYGQSKYYVNMTLFPDANTTVYQNQVYIVQLARAYEMASDTVLPSTTPPAITTTNYTRITIDPGLVSPGVMPQIRMVVQKSLSGTARAKVLSPVGKFYVVNATYQNYQAYVAESANLTFSAQESTDPVGDITKANFTWLFEGTANPSVVGYGITPIFRYAVMGQFTVNLTVLQTGGNKTYRDITVWVDGTHPVASFRTNATGTGSAVGTALSMNEGVTVRFDGSLSSDLAYVGKSGVILNSGYQWTFKTWTPVAGTITNQAAGQVSNWTFTAAGHYYVNLTVTDGVGWTSNNATMTITVNDTRPPSPSFVILDPMNGYAPVTNLIENHTYTFNAAKTMDNYDALSSLNFTWSIPGPLIGMTGASHPFSGMNITFGWSSWNLSYAVKLAVSDTGFGSGKPNAGNLMRNITVQLDQKLHPDLFISTGSMKIDNSNPEEGATVTITLNVTNKANWGSANDVYVQVTEISGTTKTPLSPSVTWLDASGNPMSTRIIASGSTVTLKVAMTVVGPPGNKTLSVTVADRNEPYTHVTSENTAQLSIAVKQAAWVTPAIIGSVIGVFAVFIFAMYYRRKVKAGDWQPLRLRRGRGEKEEGGKERTRKEKEIKEEKKRL